MEWTEQLPEDLRDEIHEIVEDTNSWDKAFDSSDNAGAAQLWTAIAILKRRNERLENMVKDMRTGSDSSLSKEFEETLRNY